MCGVKTSTNFNKYQIFTDLHSFNRDNAKSFTLVIKSAWCVPDFLGRANCKEERRECLKGELRLVGSRGILSQPIVLLFVLHRFVPCHIETGIWDSQTTYCWAVHAPQVCAEPHRDRDMIWDSQGQEFGIWDFQATYCSAVCVPQVLRCHIETINKSMQCLDPLCLRQCLNLS